MLFLLGMALTAAHAQVARPRPAVIGESLTDHDLGEIAAIAGTTIWAIKVDKVRGFFWGDLVATVYFPPEVQTPVLRRGRGLFLVRTRVRGTPGKTTWRPVYDATGPWAQVAPPDKPFGTGPASSRDVAGSFSVWGQIPDRQLVEVVQFVRGRPFYERIYRGMRDVPITAVTVKPNGEILVAAFADNGGLALSQDIIVSREGGSWKIKSVSVSEGPS